jgi:hypothetical protein
MAQQKAQFESDARLLQVECEDLKNDLAHRDQTFKGLLEGTKHLQANFETVHKKLRTAEAKLEILVNPLLEFEEHRDGGALTSAEHGRLHALMLTMRTNVLDFARVRRTK